MPIKELDILLKSMNPEIDSKQYVFCTFNKFQNLNLNPKMIFHEKEGVTIIIDKKSADKNNFQYNGIWSLITLNIHSDLNAIGFLAVISKILAEAGIPINAVSAYYHDHLFVPDKKSREALRLLKELSNSSY